MSETIYIFSSLVPFYITLSLLPLFLLSLLSSSLSLPPSLSPWPSIFFLLSPFPPYSPLPPSLLYQYSLPLPKGGRRPDQLLLSPSQKLTFRLPRTRNRPHPLDPDYIGQASPFSANDVTSRGAQIAFRSRGGHFKSGGAWHRNPNQVRKGKK